MTLYKYHAINKLGDEVFGSMEATSDKDLVIQLKLSGLLVLSIDKTSHTLWSRFKAFFSSKKISLSEQSIIARQLSILLSSGITIDEALMAIIEQLDPGKAKESLIEIRRRVVEGETLGSSIDGVDSFVPLFATLVKSGEESGSLELVMSLLSDYLENSLTLRQKVVGAMIYPAVVSIVAIMAITLMMIYVVPQVVSVFEDTKQVLPTITIVLIAISNCIKNHLLLITAIIASVIYIFIRIYRRFRYSAHQILMSIPIIYKLLIYVDSAKLASTISILLKGGVPLVSALSSAKNVLQLLPLRAAIDRYITDVNEGGSLSKSMYLDKLFPNILIQMIRTGESTGNLADLLEKSAKIIQEDSERRIMMIATAMEPTLILFMGLVVLTIVLAILTPILDLNTMVH